MSQHFDALETRAPADREAALLAALPVQIAHAQAHAPAFAELLHGVDAAQVNSRAALAQLPVIRKYELLERQKAARLARQKPALPFAPPFGEIAHFGQAPRLCCALKQKNCSRRSNF